MKKVANLNGAQWIDYTADNPDNCHDRDISTRVADDTIAEMKVEAHERDNPIIQFIVAEYNSWNPAIAKAYFPRPQINPIVQRQHDESVQRKSNARLVTLGHKRNRGVIEHIRPVSSKHVVQNTSGEATAYGQQRDGGGASSAIIDEYVNCKHPEGCTRNGKGNTKGMCHKHGEYANTHQGKTLKMCENPVVPVQEYCKHPDGCTSSGKGKTKGLCREHGGQARCAHGSDCLKPAESFGLCGAHGGRLTCRHESNCPKPPVGRGLCIAHGGYILHTHEERFLAIQEYCKHPDGCRNKGKGNTKSMCHKHGGRERCTHESDCHKQAASKGLCCAHGGRKRKRSCTDERNCSKPAFAKVLSSTHEKGRQCIHDSGCENRIVSKGVCAEHARVKKRTLVVWRVVDEKDRCKHSEGCVKSGKGKTKGLCGVHGGHAKCEYDSDCPKQSISKGLCSEHGGTILCTYENGCVSAVVSKGLCFAHGGGMRCEHDSGCQRRSQRGGLCAMHLRKAEKGKKEDKKMRHSGVYA